MKHSLNREELIEQLKELAAPVSCQRIWQITWEPCAYEPSMIDSLSQYANIAIVH